MARAVGAVQPAEVADQAAALDRTVKRIRQMVEARRHRAATRLANLDSSPKTLAVDLDRATEARRRLRDKMTMIPALRRELETAREVENERAEAVERAWGEVYSALESGLARLDPTYTERLGSGRPDADAILEAIRRVTVAAGLNGAEQRREQHVRRVAELGGRLADARQRLADARQAADQSLREARGAQAEARLRPDWPAGGLVQAPLSPSAVDGGSADPHAGALDALLVELSDHPLPDTIDHDGDDANGGRPSWAPSLSVEVLEDLLERLQERINVTRHTVGSLEDALGVAAADVDAEDAERVAESMARSLEVRRRAVEIVSVASRNVMHQVLPSTLEHMRHLLPYLTDGRYFDARLTDDFRIEVWDEAAGDWRRKTIFSGGAKDQFSLALRLAFALATLPEERGAAPSFLFLDEPLGGFDPDRARALVGLLTEGAVAESFDQIFLISHVPVEEEAFDYRLVLDAGQVVESDLSA